jgi:hypothetical protein
MDGGKKEIQNVGQPEGKKLHATWKDDIKLDLREMVC